MPACDPALDLILEIGIDAIASRVLALATLVRAGARERGLRLACEADGAEAITWEGATE